MRSAHAAAGRPQASRQQLSTPAPPESPRSKQPHFTVEVATGRTHTDADAYHLSRAGIPTGLVSIPTRYIHTVNEMVNLHDLDAGVTLLARYLEEAHSGDYTL